VIHQVMHNGQHYQTIVYDSKNHRQYRHSFVEKLLIDKANAGAEHAVLVTSVFPSGERDLCIVDGVVLANKLTLLTRNTREVGRTHCSWAVSAASARAHQPVATDGTTFGSGPDCRGLRSQIELTAGDKDRIARGVAH
jgi:hypothetical protein